MSFDLWTHQYCLACDKQVLDGAAYCSESCRLSDFEKTPSSPSSSRASSPGISVPQSWAAPAPALAASRPSKAPSALYLSPAYDFANAQPYGTTPIPKSFLSSYTSSSSTRTERPARQLTPSSSHSSLCSMQSTASDASRLSAVAKKELQAYAVSFEQVRMQRRRSY